MCKADRPCHSQEHARLDRICCPSPNRGSTALTKRSIQLPHGAPFWLLSTILRRQTRLQSLKALPNIGTRVELITALADVNLPSLTSVDSSPLLYTKLRAKKPVRGVRPPSSVPVLFLDRCVERRILYGRMLLRGAQHVRALTLEGSHEIERKLARATQMAPMQDYATLLSHLEPTRSFRLRKQNQEDKIDRVAQH